MINGVPEEMKNNEQRVDLTPDGTHELVKRGYQILINIFAGTTSGFRNTGDEKVIEKVI